ncbi:thiolase family protein [Halobellus salinisoli]|uniref:thiolase family protein n=1 Tax=Halobellus salinisoli TaxID=3108500 RepID=UPI00300B4793
MRDAVIVDAVRTPFGAHGGLLRDTHPQDLAAEPLKALEDRNGFDPDIVDDVIYGCITPVDEQSKNIGRLAPMVAGWGDGIPGVQLHRFCGSGQQAVNFAAANVESGRQDVVVAGGVEHMTRIPMGSDGELSDMSDTYYEEFDEITHQGEGAERIAEKYDLTREDVDQIAVDSQKRWSEAWEAGYYDNQVVPVETEVDGEAVTVERDGNPRPGTDMETLSELPLAFREEGNGVHHAGNSSGIVDGSSAALITSREIAEERGWDPLAKIRETQVVGADPLLNLTGPIPATEEVMAKSDLDLEDIDLFEVNEAFASVVGAWLEETGVPWEKTNVNGGAIAHGHPPGATGTMLLGKLAHELERTGNDFALSTMCIGYGQGIATIIERL